jgi:DNA-binding winged helix-turn-helix (wHTH) protein
MAGQRFAFGPFVLDVERGVLMREGRTIAVGQKGLALLHALVQAPGHVLSKTDLMEAAWPRAVVEESNLSVQVAALRKLLGPQPYGSGWIATVPRVGYRFTAKVETLERSAPNEFPAAHFVGRASIAVLPFTNVSGEKEQDEKNPYSHYALAICSNYANAPEQAVLAAERAIEISPSFALGHLVPGMAHLFRGCASEAGASLERGLTLNAYDPQNFVWYNLLALAHLFGGGSEEALAASIKGRKVRPSWRPTYETLTCCYVSLDRMAEAAACMAEMRQLEQPSGDALQPMRLRNSRWAQQMTTWLASVHDDIKGASIGGH